jgi:hypothetical protein
MTLEFVAPIVNDIIGCIFFNHSDNLPLKKIFPLSKNIKGIIEHNNIIHKKTKNIPNHKSKGKTSIKTVYKNYYVVFKIR